MSRELLARGVAERRAQETRPGAPRSRRPASTETASSTLVAEILSLQRSAGNRVATAYAPIIQAKLLVGSANDPAERQADEVAHHVMRQLGGSASRDFDEIGTDEPIVQRAVHAHGGLEAPIGLDGGEAGAQLSSSIEAARGGGHALPPPVRQPFERAFGTDLSSVRVHHDDRSSELNRAVSAKAFTVGSDIFLGASQYQPSTQAGQELLAHELTHTIQQGR